MCLPRGVRGQKRTELFRGEVIRKDKEGTQVRSAN